ncbi:esterase/lipase family protein [Chondromyces apiculatus]|uniref:esterase/lipase family protein n=1 Tax=Chondromyces apiculatus TaxID=51 RepID=UPI0012DE2EFD|nr:alpha/beta hydrolase [Chondromyces apiculatus]
MSLAALLPLLAVGCIVAPGDETAPQDDEVVEDDADALTVTAPVSAYFDAATTGGYVDGYRVIGSTTPPSWSWGKTELLEGRQKYRTEGYNLRVQKLRNGDTFQSSEYPLRTYNGALNQQLVDGFNLAYNNACATGTGACPDKGPTRPEARYVLLHHGPKTAALNCSTTRAPVLLVHGAMQNGNVWIRPNGDNGSGQTYPGTTQKDGFVKALEDANICTYAVTFGNFHGDNFNHAINLANAIARVKALTGRSKVNVVAWSKGVLPVDLYLANVSSWTDWGTKYFEQIAAEQAKQVPAFRQDVRTYVALSGPHLGIDLNFRHPYNPLLIYSTAENAPLGQGPVTWSFMSAVQCVTWGYSDSPDDLPMGNPYAYSVCENRGGMWPDFWTRIYTSNITGLDTTGKPVYAKSLKVLNTEQGVTASSFSFDKYNLAMWGSVDESGKYVSPYLGQLQAAYDLRSYYPIPNRQDDPVSYDWSTLDTDETKWRDWMSIKLGYNPVPPYVLGGYVDDDAGHIACRQHAYTPGSSPCTAKHAYYHAATAKSYLWGYGTYDLMGGIGIQATTEMGGNFINRLKSRGLSPNVDYLYVLHGTSSGQPGSIFEIDGMATPSSDPHGDGVLFDVSIAARDQLTQGWTSTQKTSKSKQEGLPYGHLEMGVTPAVFTKMIAQFNALP